MMADAYGRKERQDPAPSGLDIPIGWSLQGAAFSWLEEAMQPRSAEEIYARLTKRRPDILLKSRVPTHTMPCRECAAGDWLDHGLEVAVTGEDFSVQITLVEKLEARRPLVLASTRAIEEIRALTDQRTRMKQLSLSVAIVGLAPDIANVKFASALGLPAPEIGVVNQRYRKNMRKRMGSNHDGCLEVAFELATTYDSNDMHSLQLTSEARTLPPLNSSHQEDWSILLGASLATISSIVV